MQGGQIAAAFRQSFEPFMRHICQALEVQSDQLGEAARQRFHPLVSHTMQACALLL